MGFKTAGMQAVVRLPTPSTPQTQDSSRSTQTSSPSLVSRDGFVPVEVDETQTSPSLLGPPLICITVRPGEGAASVAGRLAEAAGFSGLDFPTRAALADLWALGALRPGATVALDATTVTSDVAAVQFQQRLDGAQPSVPGATVALEAPALAPQGTLRYVVQRGEGRELVAGRLAELAGLGFPTYAVRKALADALGIEKTQPLDALSFDAAQVRQQWQRITGASGTTGELSAVSSVAGLQPKVYPRTLMLAVGIDDYTLLPDLRYAQTDAQRAVSALSQTSADGDLIAYPLENRTATREVILHALGAMARDARAGDRIVVYLAGHGVDGRFMTADDTDRSAGISAADLQSVLGQSNASQALVIVDMCKAGSLQRDATASDAAGQYQGMGAGKVSYLLSSRADQNSLEGTFDVNGRSASGGVFSWYLAQGLSGAADQDGNRVLTLEELFEYISVHVRQETGEAQVPVALGNPNTPLGSLR